MAATGAERVARHRQNTLDRIADLEAEVSKWRTKFGEMAGRATGYETKIMDLEETVENLRRYNKGRNARIRELEAMLELSLADDGSGVAVDFDALAAMDVDQLRQWVKVGQRMERKGHDDPVSNATRWVEGNRLTAGSP